MAGDRLSIVSPEVAVPYSSGTAAVTAVEIYHCPPGYNGTSCEMEHNCNVGPSPYYNYSLLVRHHQKDIKHRSLVVFPPEKAEKTFQLPKQGTMELIYLSLFLFLVPIFGQNQRRSFSPTCYLDTTGELICDQCPPGYTGPHCDRCSEGYHGHPMEPGGSCQPCRCIGNLDLSAPRSCDPVTGACLKCREGFGGQYCESCSDGYFGDAIVAKNCQPCQCNNNGSMSEMCNPQTGQCECRQQVVGKQCDKCMENVEGLRCDRSCHCSHIGNNCDATTGQCICPPHTIGEKCDLCAPNYWGHDIISGCKPCGCNVMGSLTLQCNSDTGCCFCRPGFAGEKCTDCKEGYQNFPQCIACECSLSGTASHTCDTEMETCSCTDRTGQCTCKITAYGGKLNYAIYFEARDETGRSTYEPQVIIRGSANKDKVIVRHMPAFQMGQLTRHKIDLIENKWKFHGSNDVRTMSREDFMDVLFNIEYILIKASYGNLMRQSRISEISLEVAEEGESTFESERAYQIEKCECPRGYSGLSCEENVEGLRCDRCKTGTFDLSTLNPLGCSKCYCFSVTTKCTEARGLIRMWITAYGGKLNYAIYFEARDETGRSTYEPQVIIRGSANKDKVIVRHMPALQMGQLTRHKIDLIENKWKFHGSNDVRTMSREVFMDVLFNIEYILIKASYGNLMRQSSFSPTCAMEGFLDFRCTSCPSGYEGQYCDRCSPGFYGDPRSPGNSCQEFCDDECTGLLLNDLDSLGRMVISVNLTGPLPLPYKVLNRFENITQELKHHLSPRRTPERLFQLAGSNLDTLMTEMAYDHAANVDIFHHHPRPCNFSSQTHVRLSKEDARRKSVEDVIPTCHTGSKTLDSDQKLSESEATNISADGEQTNADAERTRKRAEDLDKFVKDSLQASEGDGKQASPGNGEQASPGNGEQASSGKLTTPGNAEQASPGELTSPGDGEQACPGDGAQAPPGNGEQASPGSAGVVPPNATVAADPLEVTAGVEPQEATLGGEPPDQEDLEEFGRNIRPLRAQFEYKVEELTEGLTENNLPELVLQAENHAAQLNDSSSILDGILAEAKNLSFNATAAFKAYTNIKHSIEEAENIANQAKARATEAVQLASSPKGSLKDDAKTSLQKSFRLWNEAKKLDNIVKDTSSKLQAAKDKARHANETASDVLGRIKDINMNLMGLQKNYSKLEDGVARANAIIQDPVKNINAASAKVKDLEVEADRLLEKLKPIKELQNNLKKNISQIKELINQARKQANSVKVFVSSGGDCIRTYRPEIKKGSIGRNGTISVHALEGPKASIMPSTFSGVSPSDYAILDVDANAYLFVGGLTTKIKKADAVKTTTFSGCTGETYLVSKPIGLWNYRERQGNCKGCVVSPQPPDTEGTVQFDGEGYAAVSRPTRWNPNVSTVMFKFRTFSTNALLMYFTTKDMKDFMSIELNDGRIKVSYDLGSGTASVSSTQHHNDGKWKALTMSREQKNTNVAIVDIDTNKEEKIETVSGGTSSGLNLKDSERIYFGGLPTLRNFSFRKPGFVELNPFSFDVGTEISFSFITQNDTGIILFGSGEAPAPPRRKRRQTGQPYAAVFLYKGHLEVVIFIGTWDPRRAMMKPEEGILHDGRKHSIKIERTRGKFTVQVDEENRLAQSLPTDQSINIKKLFVGGIPTYVQASMLRSINPFEGCIWNLVINTLPIDFAQSVSFENAEIGQCPNLAPPPKPLPEEEIDEVTQASEQSLPKPAVTTKPIVRQSATSAPVTCAAETEPVTLLNAKQFGLSRNSHVAMAFDDTKVKSRLTPGRACQCERVL
ncbi:UNVERIFIED_CONTAM: hypothetical protein FKN15_056113 [Acipenser sinensis]